MSANIPQSGRVDALKEWLAGIQQHSHQQRDSPLYLVLGPAGAGKTHALKHYRSSVGSNVYSFAVPEQITLANLLKELLIDLHMGSSSRDVFELIEEVKAALTYTNTASSSSTRPSVSPPPTTMHSERSGAPAPWSSSGVSRRYSPGSRGTRTCGIIRARPSASSLPHWERSWSASFRPCAFPTGATRPRQRGRPRTGRCSLALDGGLRCATLPLS
jgi:hypothetical protein